MNIDTILAGLVFIFAAIALVAQSFFLIKLSKPRVDCVLLELAQLFANSSRINPVAIIAHLVILAVCAYFGAWLTFTAVVICQTVVYTVNDVLLHVIRTGDYVVIQREYVTIDLRDVWPR